MACSLVYLSLVVSKKAPWVFVKERTIGNVVQADREAFWRMATGGTKPSQGFGMRFVRDAFAAISGTGRNTPSGLWNPMARLASPCGFPNGRNRLIAVLREYWRIWRRAR